MEERCGTVFTLANERFSSFCARSFSTPSTAPAEGPEAAAFGVADRDSGGGVNQRLYRELVLNGADRHSGR